MGIIAWLSLLKFNWLRRCRTCGVRGSKCLCRRPSLALEHIFFLEERKNKFGARNFSHVSDTMMTSNSTMFASSTTGTGPASSLSGSTVVMRGARSSVDSDVNPTDYYNQTAPPEGNGELLTPRLDQKTENQLRAHGHPSQNKKQRGVSHRNSKVSGADDAPSAALVRKYSGRMMSKARHNGDKSMQPPIKDVATGEYILYSEENIPVSLPHRQQQKQIVPRDRRRSRAQSNKSIKMTNTLPQHKEEPGVSFQFYGRCGAPVPPPPAMLSNRSASMRSSCSTNDSFIMGSSSISSTRVSQYSDRVSLETNFGSLNPQSNLTNTGRFIDSGYTPSIQEDEEAQALEQLSGWLHASSVSTQGSFMLSR
ncbi:uncharacterized protein PITG_11153 [Phytophthora infestans T30-4]|uniref:Uncharacterized protein n=1 Tax=Phytophthora infestans (strain T30-4) TaxID=403677 RepID=D0NGB0_PHYIT|nr:uncharacterized protein PITG_11153 [Phytophthora infestans T30-4]EEY57311.1 conserved hypothetical protein [Phytophthora infestans T30-4]|eukprot:XP_002901921.1 conserved hypothetical protein [Phytophthora infestans T30-4]